MSHPVELVGVTKKFGDFTAVGDMSFHLGQGEIVGFLGPNGAGKSTSLRIALGIMSPDEGEVSLYGANPALHALRRVGFLPEERGLYKRMSAREIIIYFAKLKGLSTRQAQSRADELLERFGLSQFRKSRISRLSKGMAQKVQILSTFAHRPDILILDEPFSGLDPVNQADLEEMIREEHARGTTILFSTHVMEHAERLCDRIILVASGRKMFDGTLGEAYATLPAKVKLATPSAQNLSELLSGTVFDVLAEPAAEDDEDKSWWTIHLPDGASSQDALKLVLEKGASIEGFEPGDKRLRDVFVRLVNEADEKYGALRHG